jgi:hypothetical protein
MNEKRIWITYLLTTLPDILLYLPYKNIQGKILKKNPPTEKDMRCRTSMIKYICDLSNTMNADKRSYEELLRKYSNCKVAKK